MTDIQPQFDVFLAHNSLDKLQVRNIARQLELRGIRTWLDEEQIRPGLPFQDEIQQAIPLVKSAAIFLGVQGLGVWQNWELRALISRCVRNEIPIIPILLPGVNENELPENKLFLKELRFITFSTEEDAIALDFLEWGITGNKPQRNLQSTDEKPGQIPTKEIVSRILNSLVPKLEKFNFEIITIKTSSKTIETKNSFWQKQYETQITIHTSRLSGQAEYFTEDLDNEIGLEMVSIPEGSFLMGSPLDEAKRQNSESPQHEVTVPPFFMGKYPITQAQWLAVAVLKPVKMKLKPDPSRFKGDNLPVEQISWYEAVEFCDRLSKKTNRNYRLASEAEWEYACRAGTTTPFHFGKTITSELANYDANYTYGDAPKGQYRATTTPVGSFKSANAFGLYDMHGNVWEWCADHWHSDYKGAPKDGSSWINQLDNDNISRLLRGGSWGNYPWYCRSAFRYDLDPDGRYYCFGFRVVVSAART